MKRKEKMILLELLIRYINQDKYITWEEIKKDEISIDLIVTNLMLEYLN